MQASHGPAILGIPTLNIPIIKATGFRGSLLSWAVHPSKGLAEEVEASESSRMSVKDQKYSTVEHSP
jgi:hypothetical protein